MELEANSQSLETFCLGKEFYSYTNRSWKKSR